MTFIGALTSYAACQQAGGCEGIDNTPDTGWMQLWKELFSNAVTRPTILRWSTDIVYQIYP